MSDQPTGREETLEPQLPIVDAHHHLWDRPGSRFMLEEYLQHADGHNIVASVYVQCREMYRTSGPEEFRVIGETEFANGMAARSESGRYGSARICSAIVAYADLLLGDRVEPVLEAHREVGGGRFRGVRHVTVWDEDESLLAPGYLVSPHMFESSDFRKGLACLAGRGLVFEALLLHPQLRELVRLARSIPELTIVLNHVGLPVNIGRFSGRQDEVYADWARSIAELAQCPNVSIKLGGLGLHWPGCAFSLGDGASSSDIATAWRPYIEHCIETFGAGRCMFESNFPPDGRSTDFHTLWNAFKRIAAGASEDERAQLFSQTAANVYRLNLPKA